MRLAAPPLCDVGVAVGVVYTEGVGVPNDTGAAVGTTEGDGVTKGVAETCAVVVTRVEVDVAVDVSVAVWLLLVNEVHPAISNEAATASTDTANNALLIYGSARTDN